MAKQNKKPLVNEYEYERFLKTALAFNGSVTPRVIKKVSLVIAYASLISYLCYLYPSIILPVGPFEYGGFIMGLILVFRINTGYDRWWEARKLWGNVVNQSRNLSVIINNYTNRSEIEWLFKISNMIAIFPYLMKDNLRGITDLEYLSHRVPSDIFIKLEQSNHRPLMLASLIAHEFLIARNNYGLDPFTFLKAQEKLDQLIDTQGACERILKTPIPFVMAVKSRRFILFFILMLPFALANISVLVCPLITGIVSYAIFSLDQIGFELQNPFSEKNLSHLPLDNICKNIDKNVIETHQTLSNTPINIHIN